MAPPGKTSGVAQRACAALADAQASLSRPGNQGIDLSALMPAMTGKGSIALSNDDLKAAAKELLRLSAFRNFTLDLAAYFHPTRLSLGGQKIALNAESVIETRALLWPEEDGRPFFAVPEGEVDARKTGVVVSLPFLPDFTLPFHGLTRRYDSTPVSLWKEFWGGPPDVQERIRARVPFETFFPVKVTDVTHKLADKNDAGSLRSVIARALLGSAPADDLIDSLFRPGRDSDLTRDAKAGLSRVLLTAHSFNEKNNVVRLDLNYQEIRKLLDTGRFSFPSLLAGLDKIMAGKSSRVVFKNFPVLSIAHILGRTNISEGTADIYFNHTEKDKWFLGIENLRLRVETGEPGAGVMMKGALHFIVDPGKAEIAVHFKNVRFDVSGIRPVGLNDSLLAGAGMLVNGETVIAVADNRFFLRRAELDVSEVEAHLESADKRKFFRIASGTEQKGHLFFRYDAANGAANGAANKFMLTLPVLKAQSGSRPKVTLNDLEIKALSHPPKEIPVRGRLKLRPQKSGFHPLSVQASARYQNYLIEGAFYLDPVAKDGRCRMPMRGFAQLAGDFQATQLQTWASSRDVFGGLVSIFSGLVQSFEGIRAVQGSFRGSLDLKRTSGKLCTEKNYSVAGSDNAVWAQGVSGCITASLAEQSAKVHADRMPAVGLQNSSVVFTHNSRGFAGEGKSDLIPQNLFFDVALNGAHIEMNLAGPNLRQMSGSLRADAHVADSAGNLKGEAKARLILRGGVSDAKGEIFVQEAPRHLMAMIGWNGKQFGFEGALAGAYQIKADGRKTDVRFTGRELFKAGALRALAGPQNDVKLLENFSVTVGPREKDAVFYEIKMDVHPAFIATFLSSGENGAFRENPSVVFSMRVRTKYLPRNLAGLIGLIKEELKKEQK